MPRINSSRHPQQGSTFAEPLKRATKKHLLTSIASIFTVWLPPESMTKQEPTWGIKKRNRVIQYLPFPGDQLNYLPDYLREFMSFHHW